MRIEMEFTGLAELVKAIETAASDSEIAEANEKIVKRVQGSIQRAMHIRIPKSSDTNRSGRGNSTVSSHAADAIPLGKVKLKETRAEADIGWTKADNSEHFYVKFINWGTVKTPPREFIYAAGRDTESEIQDIAEQEYQALLDRIVR